MFWNFQNFCVYLYMKIQKSTRVIDGYQMKKQLHGGFKIVEYSHVEGQPASARKRTLHKNLLLTDAESLLYKLESKK